MRSAQKRRGDISSDPSIVAEIYGLLPPFDPGKWHPEVCLCTMHLNALKGKLQHWRKGGSTIESMTGIVVEQDDAQCLLCPKAGGSMARAKKAAQVVINDIPDILITEYQKRLDAMEQEIVAQLMVVGKGKETTTAPETKRQWCVRQALEDKGLEATLNALAQAGWQIYAIFDPRGGAYRVVAWREERV